MLSCISFILFLFFFFFFFRLTWMSKIYLPVLQYLHETNVYVHSFYLSHYVTSHMIRKIDFKKRCYTITLSFVWILVRCPLIKKNLKKYLKMKNYWIHQTEGDLNGMGISCRCLSSLSHFSFFSLSTTPTLFLNTVYSSSNKNFGYYEINCVTWKFSVSCL